MSKSAILKAYPKTPELDKMKAVKEKSQAIGEFIDIFLTDKGCYIGHPHDHEKLCGLGNVQAVKSAAHQPQPMVARFNLVNLSRIGVTPLINCSPSFSALTLLNARTNVAQFWTIYEVNNDHHQPDQTRGAGDGETVAS